MSDCKDCLQAKAIEGKVNRIAKENVDYEKRITKLERKSDVNDERFDRVFEKLDEIIAVLKEREQRLPNLVSAIMGTAVGGALGGIIVWTLTNAN